MINLEILGKFYDNHSLSLINRQLAVHLNGCSDFNLFLTPLDNINPNCAYDSFEKTNESYVIGLDYIYQNNNVSWKHLSSFQVSNTSKEFSSNYDLNYDNKYSWHQNDLIYDINKRYLTCLSLYFSIH